MKFLSKTIIAAAALAISTAGALAATWDSPTIASAAPFEGYHAGITYLNGSGTSQYLPVYPGDGIQIKGSMGGGNIGWNKKVGPGVFGVFGEAFYGSLNGKQHYDYGGGAFQDQTVTVKALASVGVLAGVPFNVFGIDLMPYGKAKMTFGMVVNHYHYADPSYGIDDSSTNTNYGAHFNWAAGIEGAISRHTTLAAEYGPETINTNSGHDSFGSYGNQAQVNAFKLTLTYYTNG